jgi:hypothetical protein
MPMIAKCDHCGRTTGRNVFTEPVVSQRGKLTVQIKVLKTNGSEPIVCEHCARLAAYYASPPEPA